MVLRKIRDYGTLPALVATFLAFGSLVSTPAAVAEEPVAQIEAVRSGRTPVGATRIVFETDRPIEYLTVESQHDNAWEVHLIETALGDTKISVAVSDGRVDRVDFRGGSKGVIAHVIGDKQPLTLKTFALNSPPRVVVDLLPSSKARTDAGAAAKLSNADDGPAPTVASPMAEPKLVRKPFRTVDGKPHGQVEVAQAASEASPSSQATSSEPNEVPRSASLFEVGSAGDAKTGTLDDLILWIHALKTRVDALRNAESEVERAAMRRQMGHLLAERGILVEAEKSIVSSLESPGADSASAFADSLFLAEIRLDLGRTEEAAEVARTVDSTKRSPAERHRHARILARTRLPGPAGELLKSAIPALPEQDAAAARLLLARCLWDQKDTAGAYTIAKALTKSSSMPEDLLAEALIIEGDCLAAAGKATQAEALYRRASMLPLDPAEASWTGLQLGNLARRAGREDEARRYYQETSDSFPDTFFGAQAAWFLQVVDKVGELREQHRASNRG